jgi:hypothetical protein
MMRETNLKTIMMTTMKMITQKAVMMIMKKMILATITNTITNARARDMAVHPVAEEGASAACLAWAPATGIGLETRAAAEVEDGVSLQWIRKNGGEFPVWGAGPPRVAKVEAVIMNGKATEVPA